MCSEHEILGDVERLREPLSILEDEFKKEVRFDEGARGNFGYLLHLLSGKSTIARSGGKAVNEHVASASLAMQDAVRQLANPSINNKASMVMASLHVRTIARRHLPAIRKELGTKARQERDEMAKQSSSTNSKTSNDTAASLREWLDRLQEATLGNSGVVMCEATRMVLGMGSILHAYHPNDWTRDMADRAVSGFEAALARTGTIIEKGLDSDLQNALYRDNIRDRLDTLLNFMPIWCPGWSRANKG